MPPSRFGASKFRNAVAAAPERATWYRGKLPAASSSSTTSSSTSTFSSEIKTSRRWIVTVSPTGDVSWRFNHSQSGSGDGEEGEIGSMKVGLVGDWDLSVLEDETLALGGTDGIVTVYTMPQTVSRQPAVLHTFSVGSAITNLALHPTTPSVLLVAAAQAPLAIYNISDSSTEPVVTLKTEEPKGIWSAAWSPHGRQVAAIGRSGKCYVFDPRQSPEPLVVKSLSSIQPLRPARVTWVGDKVFLTGTDRSRNRLYSLLSPSDLGAIFVQNVDTNLAPLVSAVDQERQIIYLSGRGDMTVRQIELGGVTGFQESVHALPHALASTSIAAAHPASWDVMQAEISKVMLPIVDKDGDTILPLSIKVPRRQLIDYHEDLYPDVTGTSTFRSPLTYLVASSRANEAVPEQTATEWLSGGDAKPLSFTLDPSRRATWASKLSKAASTPASGSAGPTAKAIKSEEPKVEQAATSTAMGTTTPKSVDQAVNHETVDIPTPSASTTQPRPDTPSPRPTGATPARTNEIDPAPASSETQQNLNPPVSIDAKSTDGERKDDLTSQTRSKSTSTPKPTGERYNPGWSRKFLAGKSPLNPTYDSLPPLSSLHQDSLIFKVSPHLAFFPVQGPGGRLGVHPLKKKGRVTTGGEGYLSCGVEIADFDVEPFTGEASGVRVALAGEDGVIRIWTVGEDGIKGVGPEATAVLSGDGIDKIATIAFHPTAKDLLTVLSNDRGTCAVRLFDLEIQSEVRKVSLDLDGAFNMIWSAAGDRVALSTKDGRVAVLDPRRPDSMITGPAHDSPRSIQIAWIDDTHLVSVGFSKGSQRRINLYAIEADKIATLSSTLIDVSPSVLFPAYDPDTSILYVWGKGERQIQAYEVRPTHSAEPISKLPSFTGGSPQLGVAFFPKRMVDIRKVEVGKALRLTARAIEEVSFSIPRNKPDFFQDDIYVDTLDVESPTHTSVSDWLEGKGADERYISLKPAGMTPLSQAPKADTAAKKKFVPAANVMSEQEKKQKEMDDLFRKAKLDESSDEDDEPKRSGLDPPDDDW